LSEIIVRELIDAGIHFGHRVSRWNPKMKPYIYGKRNLIHIIDVKETIKGLVRARKFLTQVVADGKDVLFVATKRQAKAAVVAEADRAKMPFVSERWLGGTLTNFRTIRERLKYLEQLEALQKSGEIDSYSKKMIAKINREVRKITRNLSGIRTMNRLPGAVFVVDPRRERNAILEARKLGIPTLALMDTDSDPDEVDLVIPGNDDAMRSIEMVIKHLADAVVEGMANRAARPMTPERMKEVSGESEEKSADRRPRGRRSGGRGAGGGQRGGPGGGPGGPGGGGRGGPGGGRGGRGGRGGDEGRREPDAMQLAERGAPRPVVQPQAAAPEAAPAAEATPEAEKPQQALGAEAAPQAEQAQQAPAAESPQGGEAATEA
jgi:small subunit ribosomal protein S2